MNLEQLVDQYIQLDSEIKRLTIEKDSIKESLIAQGEGTNRASLGSVTVSLSQRKLISQDKLKAKFGDQLDSCYDTYSSITVRISRY